MKRWISIITAVTMIFALPLAAGFGEEIDDGIEADLRTEEIAEEAQTETAAEILMESVPEAVIIDAPEESAETVATASDVIDEFITASESEQPEVLREEPQVTVQEAPATEPQEDFASTDEDEQPEDSQEAQQISDGEGASEGLAASTEETPESDPDYIPVLTVQLEGNAERIEDVWQIIVLDASDQIRFIWNNVQANTYHLRILDASRETVLETQTSALSWVIPFSDLPVDEDYSLLLTAIYTDAEPLTASLDFRICWAAVFAACENEISLIEEIVMIEETTDESADAVINEETADVSDSTNETETEENEDTDSDSADAETETIVEESGSSSAPKGTKKKTASVAKKSSSGGRSKPSAKRNMGGSVSSTTAEDDSTLRLDELSDESILALTVNGTALELTLDNGESTFTASLSGNVLTLTPSEDAKEWTATLSALNTLQECGITALEIGFDGNYYHLDLLESAAEASESNSSNASSASSAILWCLNGNGMGIKWNNQTILWTVSDII